MATTVTQHTAGIFLPVSERSKSPTNTAATMMAIQPIDSSGVTW